MTVSLTRTQQVSGNGLSLSATTTYAYGGNPHVSESIPNGTVNVDCVFKYTALTFIAIFASGTLTLQAKTAAGVSNGSLITVTSTKSFIWASDDGTANPFSADIAYFEVVNATGADVTLNIEPLTDATP
jgi:hypothetical protein